MLNPSTSQVNALRRNALNQGSFRKVKVGKEWVEFLFDKANNLAEVRWATNTKNCTEFYRLADAEDIMNSLT